MRIGIDCDGVLRDFIGSVQDTIKKYHPELADQLKTPTDWSWETWIPFWTEEETEKFVFEDHTEEIFYTADASFINATNMMDVAKTMNKKFLEK